MTLKKYLFFFVIVDATTCSFESIFKELILAVGLTSTTVVKPCWFAACIDANTAALFLTGVEFIGVFVPCLIPVKTS